LKGKGKDERGERSNGKVMKGEILCGIKGIQSRRRWSRELLGSLKFSSGAEIRYKKREGREKELLWKESNQKNEF
jgi:hypothetical protein